MRPSLTSRLPPLNALRGFEAAARLGSFARAGDELALTQSAVSHQVRQLEAALGQPLFVRHARELVLTDAGRDFLETVRSALGVLSVGFERLAPYKESQSLIVSCDAAFGRLWLLPRLAKFRQLHPRVLVWLDTSEQLVDFDRQEVEVVLGRLRSVGGNRVEEAVFDDRIAPCRRLEPEARINPPLTLADLAAQTLLHDERRDNWLIWFNHVGLVLGESSGPRFSDPGLAIEAARQGLGLALASDVLVLDALLSSELETPFPYWFPIEKAYWLAYSERFGDSEALDAFITFLHAEISEYAERLDVFRRLLNKIY